MPVESKYYLGKPGKQVIVDPALLYVNILGVKREGTGFTEVFTSPGNREFLYTDFEGKVEFEIPFFGDPLLPTDPITQEKIFVIFNY